jgi:hypothetical protein
MNQRDEKTNGAIEQTMKNRRAIEREQGKTPGLLTDTSNGPISRESIGQMVRYRLPRAGLCYIVPVRRYQLKGMQGPTTEFRFATDEELATI